jgi:hypothetical protein
VRAPPTRGVRAGLSINPAGGAGYIKEDQMSEVDLYEEGRIKEKQKRIRLIRDSRRLLENALRANQRNRQAVIQDHLERVIMYMEESEKK